MSGNLSGLGFDARQVEPRTAFDVLPAGDYDVVIVNTEKKPTKAGDGAYLELTLQVCSGPHQNRKLFDRLHLWNASEKAVAIARGTLSAICRAVNRLNPGDSAELHNLPGLRCKVAVKEDQQRGKYNEVKGYKDRHAQAAAPQVGPTPQPWRDPFAPQNPQLMTGQAAPQGFMAPPAGYERGGASQQYPTVPANPFG